MPIIKIDGKHVELYPMDAIEIGEGTSPKSFLQSEQDQFILKKPKPRSLGKIFKESLPKELKSYENWSFINFNHAKHTLPEDIKTLMAPYCFHLRDLAVEAAFGEVLYMNLIGAFFPKSIEAPQTYLHIEPDTGEPAVISKRLSDFNEFMRIRLREAKGRALKSSLDWLHETKPTRAELKLTGHEDELLGKLYFVALLTNDWDLVNNIMLANSGCIGKSEEAEKVCIVDGGNKFHFGFDGLTSDETCFRNPRFKLADAHKDYRHTWPFEGAISLKLPRLLTKNLFDLNNENLLKGFLKMQYELNKTIEKHPDSVRLAIAATYDKITLDSHPETVQQLRTKNTTLFSYNFYNRSKGYCLEKMLTARINSLNNIVTDLLKGKDAETINEEQVTRYIEAQYTISPR